MPDKIKMYYSKLRNMGDCLNELIVKECFGYEAERHSFLRSAGSEAVWDSIRCMVRQ